MKTSEEILNGEIMDFRSAKPDDPVYSRGLIESSGRLPPLPRYDTKKPINLDLVRFARKMEKEGITAIERPHGED